MRPYLRYRHTSLVSARLSSPSSSSGYSDGPDLPTNPWLAVIVIFRTLENIALVYQGYRFAPVVEANLLI